MSLLEIRNITKRFGGLVAVSQLDFDVKGGEIVGLIGPNGAGKTTAFNMIAGTMRPTRGEIWFEDRKISGLKTNRIAAAGVVRTFQLTTHFSNMTVLENVVLGNHCRSGIGLWASLFNTPSARAKEEGSKDEALAILDFMGLKGHEGERAKSLPHGQQRCLEVAIALATKPTLLLLDEPLQGMNQEELRDMVGRIEKIRNQGITILLVEHNMKAVTSICNRLVVLNFGHKSAEGTPQEVMKNQQVIEAYLGVEDDTEC
jgi:branched-chain amino acid transport system ATP-binding protein